jgi:hypothetical protein
MDEDKVKEAMATRLVEGMEPEMAKQILLRVVAGDDLYEAILDDGKAGPKPERKKARRPRADKGKSRATLPDVPEEG